MANQDHVDRVIKLSTKDFNKWRQTEKADLDLKGANLTKRVLCDKNLNGKNLTRANMQNTKFNGTEMKNVDLRGCNLQETDFSKADLSHAMINPPAETHNAIFVETILSGADLTSGTFKQCDFTAATMHGVILHDTEFRACTLLRANFSNAAVTETTKFVRLKSWHDMKMDRHTLESLGPGRGGLTVGQLMNMKIRYDLSRMSGVYSGFFQWLQLASIAVFLAPYAWFVAWQWSKAVLSQPNEGISLLRALFQYVVTGGGNWNTSSPAPNWYAISLFIALTLYNIGRVILLYKTKILEIQVESTGLPSAFKLEGGWKRLFQFTKYGAFVALALAIINAVCFLLTHFVAPS